MQYGHFDNDAREYVIPRLDTPRPTSNYRGSAEFGGVITATAGGFVFSRSPAQNHLTRYPFDTTPGQQPGRYGYRRDGESGDFWSKRWMRVQKDPDGCTQECRHGTGYSNLPNHP